MDYSKISASDDFCGFGGWTESAKSLGIPVLYGANHWGPAIDNYQANHPGIPTYRESLEKLNFLKMPRSRIKLSSPECFVAGTLILTERGLVPIEDVQIGDKVLTHRNRWRQVTSVMSHYASTIILRGQGHPGIEVTAEHPFYVRKQSRVWQNSIRRWDYKVCSEPAWIPAHLLTQQRYRWATPIKADLLSVPPILGRDMPFDDPEFWWLIGRWLGDGTARIRPNHGEITIVAGNHEADGLEQRLTHWSPKNGNRRANNGELRWRRRKVRTATLFECGAQDLARWIVTHFGKLAHGKTVPAWALSLPQEHRQALLDGYVSADGHIASSRTSASTVSKMLAIGMRLLAESLGYRVSLLKMPQHGKVIEGRQLQVRNQWVIGWEQNSSQRTAFADESHAWSLVKETLPGHENIQVYTLSVEEDESYVADGLVVHNCTNYTNALGVSFQERLQPPLWEEFTDQWRKQQAQAQSRALVRQIPRATEAHSYEIVFVENVTELGQDWEFDELIEAMCNKLHYQVRQMCLNSCFFGAGLSRDRAYLVFARKDIDLPADDLTVWAHCPHCHADVPAWQDWGLRQSHTFHWGDYGPQYIYRCPQCQREVFPPTRPASDVLNLSLPMVPVSKSKIHSAKVKATIAEGIKRFGGQPFLRTYHGQPGLRTLDKPMFTAVTHHSIALAIPQGNKVEDCLHRFVTADELKVAMGYRRDYILDGTQADQYTLVGNAVTPCLTTRLLEHYCAPLAG